MQKHESGFTLIELLIALLVFSIMSVMAYAGLNSVLDIKAQTEKQAAKLVELQTAFTFIGRDFEQIISRGVRDPLGGLLPALTHEGNDGEFVEFTRAGFRNPAMESRSTLLRVAYKLDDEELVRRIWKVLDKGVNSEPVDRIMATGITEQKIEFLNKDTQSQNNWSSFWPLDRGEKDQDTLPQAIRLTLQVEGVGEIIRIFRVPNGLDVFTGSGNSNSASGTTGTVTGSGG
jgi:general secretion pathway protein J